ncbi:MAG: hypothetical protein ACR2ND_06315 [Solirubrobacteraceae bacterium]
MAATRFRAVEPAEQTFEPNPLPGSPTMADPTTELLMAVAIDRDVEQFCVASAVEGWHTTGLVITPQEPQWTSG